MIGSNAADPACPGEGLPARLLGYSPIFLQPPRRLGLPDETPSVEKTNPQHALLLLNSLLLLRARRQSGKELAREMRKDL
jgi:hypothetical protein